MADAANFSSQQLTTAEKAARAKTWSRILFGIIPEDRLLDALDRAMADHQSNYPVNGYDLKLAYERIVAAERAEQKKAEEAAALNNPVSRCAYKHLHQNEKGDVWRSFSSTEKDELAPCETCRFDDFMKWKATQVALYGEHQPLTILQKQNALQGYLNLKNPVECLNHAKDEINQKMVHAIGTPEYDELFSQRKFIFNALKWIWEKDGR